MTDCQWLRTVRDDGPYKSPAGRRFALKLKRYRAYLYYTIFILFVNVSRETFLNEIFV